MALISKVPSGGWLACPGHSWPAPSRHHDTHIQADLGQARPRLAAASAAGHPQRCLLAKIGPGNVFQDTPAAVAWGQAHMAQHGQEQRVTPAADPPEETGTGMT